MLASIEEIAKEHNLTLAEIALRWISHHSLMKREYGDAVIIGASSVKHIEQVSSTSCICELFRGTGADDATRRLQNLVDLEKGPLRK